jgi:hypothetical protein
MLLLLVLLPLLALLLLLLEPQAAANKTTSATPIIVSVLRLNLCINPPPKKTPRPTASRNQLPGKVGKRQPRRG